MRRFVVTVALGLAVGAASIFFVVRGIFVHAQQSQAVARGTLVTRVVLSGALRPSDFERPSARRIAELERLFRAHVLTSGIGGGALYAPDGTVAFSTSRRSIGTRPQSAPLLTQISTRLTRVAGTRTFDVIVPVGFGRGAPAGAVVLSQRYSAITGAAARTYIPVAIALELLLAGLFLALLPIVRRAIRQTRKHVREAESDALRDTLTGLPNRRLFDDRLAQALKQAQRDRSTAAVLLIDLDRFKEINDTLGHAAGDALLREAAGRLGDVVRASETIARIGGDEFAVVLTDGSLAAVHESALRIQQAIETPVEYDGMSLSVGASIGAAVYPDHGKSPAVLQRYADVAMYQAKRAGLGHVVFDPGTTTSDDENLSLAAELSNALERAQIVLHYQPTVAVARDEVTGVEALLRWNHPTQGLLSAEHFMPLAEVAGVRAQIYEFALVEAIRQAGAWRRAGLTLQVAINLDVRMLVDLELPDRVERLLVEHGVAPQQIEAEIAEASLLSDVDRVTAVSIALAAIGVILVVDDFGADHTSLRSLAYLPIEKLKLNRNLLVRALESGREKIVFAGIVELAHKLGLHVGACGVEDESGLALLHEVEADYAQGYYVGAPVEPEAVHRLLAATEGVAA